MLPQRFPAGRSKRRRETVRKNPRCGKNGQFPFLRCRSTRTLSVSLTAPSCAAAVSASRVRSRPSKDMGDLYPRKGGASARSRLRQHAQGVLPCRGLIPGALNFAVMPPAPAETGLHRRMMRMIFLTFDHSNLRPPFPDPARYLATASLYLSAPTSGYAQQNLAPFRVEGGLWPPPACD